eukprot:gene13963-4066_t
MDVDTTANGAGAPASAARGSASGGFAGVAAPGADGGSSSFAAYATATSNNTSYHNPFAAIGGGASFPAAASAGAASDGGSSMWTLRTDRMGGGGSAGAAGAAAEAEAAGAQRGSGMKTKKVYTPTIPTTAGRRAKAHTKQVKASAQALGGGGGSVSVRSSGAGGGGIGGGGGGIRANAGLGWRSAQAKRDGNAALLNGRIEREHEAEEASLLQSGQQVIRIKRKRGAEEPVDTMRLTVKRQLNADGTAAAGGGGVVLRRLGALDGRTNLGSDVVQRALARNIRKIRTMPNNFVTHEDDTPLKSRIPTSDDYSYNRKLRDSKARNLVRQQVKNARRSRGIAEAESDDEVVGLDGRTARSGGGGGGSSRGGGGLSEGTTIGAFKVFDFGRQPGKAKAGGVGAAQLNAPASAPMSAAAAAALAGVAAAEALAATATNGGVAVGGGGGEGAAAAASDDADASVISGIAAAVEASGVTLNGAALVSKAIPLQRAAASTASQAAKAAVATAGVFAPTTLWGGGGTQSLADALPTQIDQINLENFTGEELEMAEGGLYDEHDERSDSELIEDDEDDDAKEHDYEDYEDYEDEHGDDIYGSRNSRSMAPGEWDGDLDGDGMSSSRGGMARDDDRFDSEEEGDSDDDFGTMY